MPFRHAREADRVRRYSTPAQCAAIDAAGARNGRRHARSPAAIERRLAELRNEWSIERYLQLNGVAVGLTTLALAVTRDRRWAYGTCAALGFLLFHALDGFDPPLPLLRRLGVRTRAEIDRELYALKAARGDFAGASRDSATSDAAAAARAVAAVGL